MEVSNVLTRIDSDKLKELEEKQKLLDQSPFRYLKINDASCLDKITGREICAKCYKSRKFFCYSCYTPVIDKKYFPHLKLPLKIDIIKHEREIDGKSTAAHAAILAPDDIKIYTYPNFPEISENEKVVLIFPSKKASRVEDMFFKKIDGKDNLGKGKELPITRAIFIDSTWHQTKSIFKDPRLQELPCIILKSRISQFWRHQKKSPRWYLATIEAIHEFLVEIHTSAFGEVVDYVNQDLDFPLTSESILTQPYCGQYDNLLYFFKYMYDKIHLIYDHDELWAYKRPLI